MKKINSVSEIPADIISIKEADSDGAKKLWILVAEKSFYIVDNDSAAMNIQEYLVSNSIVDICYISQTKTFVVVYSDCTVQLISKSCPTQQSSKRYHASSFIPNIISKCEYAGTTFIVLLSKNGSLGLLNANTNDLVAYFPDAYLDSAENTTGKCLSLFSELPGNIIAMSRSSTSPGMITFKKWRITDILNNEFAPKFCCDLSLGEELDVDGVVLASVHLDMNCISICFASKIIDTAIVARKNSLDSTGTDSSTWIKLDFSGSILMKRTIAGRAQSLASSGVLSVVAMQNENALSIMDIRYGVLLQKIEVPNSNSLNLCNSIWAPMSTPSSTNTRYLTLLLVSKPNASGTLVDKVTLTLDAPSSSLLAAVGKLKANQTPTVPSGSVLAVPSVKHFQEKRKFVDVSKDSAEDNDKAASFSRLRALHSKSVYEYCKSVELISSAATDSHLLLDWNAIKDVITEGAVSLASNPNLIFRTIQERRYDVLVLLAQYVPDLSEAIAVQLLLLCLTVPPAVESSSVGTEVAAESLSISGREVLSQICMSLLSRKMSFSSVFLAEALRTIPPKFGTLLLQVFSSILKSFTTINRHSSIAQEIAADLQVMRLCEWIEAILDSYFTVLFIDAIGNNAVTQALTSSIQSILKSAKSSVALTDSLIEPALGALAHVVRMNQDGRGDYKSPPVGIYLFESISF